MHYIFDIGVNFLMQLIMQLMFFFRNTVKMAKIYKGIILHSGFLLIIVKFIQIFNLSIIFFCFEFTFIKYIFLYFIALTLTAI